MKTYFSLCLLIILTFSSILKAKTLIKFSCLIVSSDHRTVLNEIFKDFEKLNPGLQVILVGANNEKYHKNFPDWLYNKQNNNIDILFWFIGYRFNKYMKLGLAEEINDIWKSNNLYKFLPSMSPTVSFDNNVYALPISYYQWGFYYNKKIFKRFRLTPPKTWKQFLKICEILKKNNITPISIGTKNNWPAASWFSYLNLRTNGLAFHRKLMSGQASYKDKRVKKVFKYWKVLLDKKYFVKDHKDANYKHSLAYLYRKIAAMTLIGNFATTSFPEKQKRFLKYFRFPKITNQPFYEEAPTDILFIRKNSKNKINAKKLLSYMSRPDVLYKLNEAIKYISPHKKSKKASDYFISEGIKTLTKAKGYSQYFDRDTPAKMGYGGFKAFGDFMSDGDIDKAINTLEKLRKDSYK